MRDAKILIVGAGGIGSWLCYFLYNLENHKQFGRNNTINIVVADPDTVEEKNLSYQNFDMEDITDNKAKVMEAKYGFLGKDSLIKFLNSLLTFCISLIPLSLSVILLLRFLKVF